MQKILSKKIGYLDYEWKIAEGDASALSMFVIDAKNLMSHPECFVVENCKFFPYPEASCTGGCGTGGKRSLTLPQLQQKIMLAVVKADFGSSLTLNINVAFDAPPSTGTTESKDSTPILSTPTVTPHPANLLTGDINSDGYANCGNIHFNDFRIWYSKEQNNIEFYVEGKSEANF